MKNNQTGNSTLIEEVYNAIAEDKRKYFVKDGNIIYYDGNNKCEGNDISCETREVGDADILIRLTGYSINCADINEAARLMIDLTEFE